MNRPNRGPTVRLSPPPFRLQLPRRNPNQRLPFFRFRSHSVSPTSSPSRRDAHPSALLLPHCPYLPISSSSAAAAAAFFRFFLIWCCGWKHPNEIRKSYCPATIFSMPIHSLHLVRSLPLISSPRPPSGISTNCSVVFPSPLQTKNFSSSSSSRCYFFSELNGNSVGGGDSGRDGNLAIEGRNLNFSITRKKRRYGGGPSRAEELVPILNDCSIRIPIWQLWMLLGPNGCGKSTLLKKGDDTNESRGRACKLQNTKLEARGEEESTIEGGEDDNEGVEGE